MTKDIMKAITGSGKLLQSRTRKETAQKKTDEIDIQVGNFQQRKTYDKPSQNIMMTYEGKDQTMGHTLKNIEEKAPRKDFSKAKDGLD